MNILYVIIFCSVLVIIAAFVFYKQLEHVQIKWLLIFAAGVIAAIGTERAVKKAEDIRRQIPL